MTLAVKVVYTQTYILYGARDVKYKQRSSGGSECDGQGRTPPTWWRSEVHLQGTSHGVSDICQHLHVFQENNFLSFSFTAVTVK